MMEDRLHWKRVCRVCKAGSAVGHSHRFFKMPNLNQKPKEAAKDPASLWQSQTEPGSG